MMQLEADAKAILSKCGDCIEAGLQSLTVPDIKLLVKWKLGGKNPKGNKQSLIQQFTALPNPHECNTWTNEREQHLRMMMENDIRVKDMELGRARTQMVHSIASNITVLPEEQITVLEQAIRNRAVLQAQNNNQQVCEV